jgi:aldehyde dehydrogenase family 7 protein A1
LFLPEHCYDEVVERMVKGAKGLVTRIGDPMDPETLYGPMHNQQGIDIYTRTIEAVKGNYF